jgi:hypothetical protein
LRLASSVLDSTSSTDPIMAMRFWLSCKQQSMSGQMVLMKC